MNYSVKVNRPNGLEDTGNFRGYATITIDNCFKITNIQVRSKDSGELYVMMPAFKTSTKDTSGNNVYKEFCNPITSEFRKELYDNILRAYNEDVEIVHDLGEGNASYKVSVKEKSYEDSKIVGSAEINFDNSFVIHNVKVVSGEKGLFVSMPNILKKNQENETSFNDICFPVTKEFREILYKDILEKYEKVKEQEAIQKNGPSR